jgi:hypothetical protein
MITTVLIGLLLANHSVVFAQTLLVNRELQISSEVAQPIIISLTSLQQPATTELMVRPYSVDTSEIKTELENYRKMYLVVAMVIMAGLISVTHR